MILSVKYTHVAGSLPHRYLLAFLRLWLDQYPTDFHSPELSQLTLFLQEQQRQPHCPQEIIDLLHYLGSLSAVSSPLPRSKSTQSLESTKTFDLYTLSPQRFAEALTAKDAVSKHFLW